jgi:hypothetical protein
MPCPSHPPWITFGEENKLWSSLLCSFFTSLLSLPTAYVLMSSTPFSDSINIHSFLRRRN